MRRVIIGVGILVVLIVVAGLVAPAFINVNQYGPLIESKLQDRLGRKVSLGPMRLSLIPLGFRVRNAVIADDAKFNSGRPFAQVQTLSVHPELLPLLRREVEIKSIQLDRPTVELVRNQQGIWNFSTLMGDQQQASQNKPSAFSLDQLKIYDGLIAITDYQQGKPRAVYDHIDLDLSDFALDKAFSVDVRAHMPGTGEQVVALRGNIGPIQRDAVARTPFDGQFELTGASLSALQRFLNVEALANSDAIITGRADVKNSADALASTGKFDIKNPRIHGVDIGYPIAIDYQVNGNLSESKAEVQKANLKLGQTPIALHGSFNAQSGQSNPAQVDMTFQASNVSIAETARLAAAFGAVFNAANNISGNLNVNLHAQGAVTKPILNGNIEARNLGISGGDLREPVQVDAIQLSFSPDAIHSNEFTAKTGHTSAAAQFSLTGYASDAPKIEAKLNTGNADVQELLRIAHAYGISAVEGVNGSGSISVNATVSGPLKQPEQLTYNGTGAIRNASLEMPSLAKSLGVRTADLQFTGGGVNLSNLEATIGQTTARGTLTATNFSAPQLQFSLSANDINVAEWEQLFKSTGDAKGKVPAGARPAMAQTKSGSASVVTVAPQESLISRMTGTGSLTADTVVYDELTLKNVQSTVMLDHGVITLKPLNASLYNGKEIGTVVIDTRSNPPTYTVDSKLQDVDANQLLSSISPVKQTLYGLLSANADTHFTTPAGAQSILPTLTGKVSLNLKDGKVANVDLLHELGTIAKFQRAASATEPSTRVVQLTGDFDISNGVARTNNLKAAIDAGTVAAQGTVDLAHEKLNLHLTVVLTQGFSQTVGGNQIGGFLNTALANNKGELVIPVLVTGTLHQPIFAPDLESVAQMKLKNLVPDINNPSELTNGIFGQILRGKPTAPTGQPGQNPQQQQQAPDTLKNLLDGFKNKGK
jgi:AsmA protein